jgi:hypothetical protein
MIKVEIVKKMPYWSGWVPALDKHVGDGRAYTATLHEGQYNRPPKDRCVTVCFGPYGNWNFPLASLKVVGGTGIEVFKLRQLIHRMEQEEGGNILCLP